MHHHPQNQERALNLSILLVSGVFHAGTFVPNSPFQTKGPPRFRGMALTAATKNIARPKSPKTGAFPCVTTAQESARRGVRQTVLPQIQVTLPVSSILGRETRLVMLCQAQTEYVC